MEDVSKYPALLETLLADGWSEEDVAGVAGGNLLRVMRGAEKVKWSSPYEASVLFLMIRALNTAVEYSTCILI